MKDSSGTQVPGQPVQSAEIISFPGRPTPPSRPEPAAFVRTPVSKRLRFDVFKRDFFTCQYCGRKPPDVVLECDHVIPVAEGGPSEAHNLITACFDCNRGKADRPLDAPAPLDLTEKRRLLEEQREQLLEYEAFLSKIRSEDEARVDAVIAVYDYLFEGHDRIGFSRTSIRNFLKRLPLTEVQEAMELACERVNAGKVFKYFCGVCWNKIKTPRGDAE